MADKKVLNEEELEKVTGGYVGSKTQKEKVVFSFKFRVGYEVCVRVVGSVNQGLGRISERGIAYYKGYYYPIYYVIFSSGRGIVNGWFYDCGGYLSTEGEVDSNNIVQTGILD